MAPNAVHRASKACRGCEGAKMKTAGWTTDLPPRGWGWGREVADSATVG